mgnify:CR=1 FL=1
MSTPCPRVKFGLREHAPGTAVVLSTGSATGSGWPIRAANRGNLAGFGGFAGAPLAMEATVGFLHRLEGLIPLGRGDQVHLHGIETLVKDAFLEPKDLEVLRNGVNAIVGKVGVEVVLIHVELDIFVKCQVVTVPFIPEGLELCQYGRSAGNHFWSTQKLGVKGPVCLTAMLGLCEWLVVCPPIGLSPHSVEDVKYLGRVSKEPLFKGSSGLKGFARGCELVMGLVMPQDWCAGNQLLVN